ncbi:unnamed protein product [Meloidogyne enterolobii]
MSLQSCSLYEFRITAVSKYGESKPVILVQYTEPQLSPQHILATKLSPNSIELSWEPPYKRANDLKVLKNFLTEENFLKNYVVYWTDNSEARLGEWQKMNVYGRRVVFTELKYDWFYLFCAVNFYRKFFRKKFSFNRLPVLTMENAHLCLGHFLLKLIKLNLIRNVRGLKILIF